MKLTGNVHLLPELVAAGAFERVCWLDLSELRLDAKLLASLVPATAIRALTLVRCDITDPLVELIWTSFPRLLVSDLDENPCRDLVTQELTPQEMSTYEWSKTARAAALEAKHGPRMWIYPSSAPGSDRPDLEMLLARIAKRW